MEGQSINYGIVMHPQLGNWAIAISADERGGLIILTPGKAIPYFKKLIKNVARRADFKALPDDEQKIMINMWADCIELAKEAQAANREGRMPNAAASNSADVGSA